MQQEDILNFFRFVRKHWVAFLVGFLAFQLGQFYGTSNPVEYRYDTVTETETVTEYVPTSLPPACNELTDAVFELTRAATRVDGGTTETLDAISDARAMIADQSIVGLNEIDERLQEISSSTLGGSESLSNRIVLLERFGAKCDEQIAIQNNNLD